MISISALTPGILVPSSRFRVRQYIPALKDSGFLIKEFPAKIDYSAKLPGFLGRVRQRYIFPLSASWIGIKAISRMGDILKSDKFDLVWLNRIIVNLLFLEKYIRQPIIYDVDDAIWINNEKLIGKIAKKSEVIIAGNSFIADWFSEYNKNIFIVPTAIDTNRFIANPAINKDEKFIIGWTGSADGLKYVYEIEDQLNNFLKNHENSFIKIICDQKPSFKSILPEKIIYVPWSPLLENTELQDVSVGIMPLTDNEWSRGKCSYKMLQYMSSSIPVVVSNVGMNSELIAKSEVGLGVRRTEEWQETLTAFWKDKSLGEKMGEKGRALVERDYSLIVVAKQLSEIFNKATTIN
jgi:glycosyltransferase involved in cell wall biosynthesis